MLYCLWLSIPTNNFNLTTIMKTKSFVIITLAVSAFLFVGCSLFDDTETYTVASRRTYTFDGESCLVWPYYLIKNRSQSSWQQVSSIEGFQYEAGYEYKIEAKRFYTMVEQGRPEKDLNLTFVRLISKEQKESTDLPKTIYNENWPPLFPKDSTEWANRDSIDWLLYR